MKPHLTLKDARDILLFFTGLGGVIYETLHGPSDPSLLLIFAAMMGLPAFLRSENGRKP